MRHSPLRRRRGRGPFGVVRTAVLTIAAVLVVSGCSPPPDVTADELDRDLDALPIPTDWELAYSEVTPAPCEFIETCPKAVRLYLADLDGPDATRIVEELFAAAGITPDGPCDPAQAENPRCIVRGRSESRHLRIDVAPSDEFDGEDPQRPVGVFLVMEWPLPSEAR